MTTKLLDNAIAQMVSSPTPSERKLKMQSKKAIEDLDELDSQWLHALLHLPREYWFIFLRETFEGGMGAAIDFSQGKSGVMLMQAARDFDRLENEAIEQLRERLDFGVLESCPNHKHSRGLIALNICGSSLAKSRTKTS